ANKPLAEAIPQRSFDEVKAYKKFLTHKELNHLPISFEDLPLTSKDSYIVTSDHFDLLVSEDQTIFYHRSSSLNNSLYWPQPKVTEEKTLLFKQYLEYHYHINTVKSVCIVGTYLGSWVGGQDISYGLERLSHFTDYPLSIFTPGNDVEEIVNFILKYHSDVPQFILFLCPSFIAYILDAVEDLGLHSQFPFHKLRFFVIGEPFTECFRAHLDTVCGVNVVDSSLFSAYGSADTDFIGAESIASVAIRKLIYQDSSLAQHMGFPNTLPHFFHCYAQDSYIEEVNEELCITKWQGIPLLRYNLHDKVQLYKWKELRDFVLAYKLENQHNNPLYQVIEKAGENLPDVIALFGRSDSNLKLQDTFISEEILDHVTNSKLLSKFLTGHYKASVEYDEHDHQYLSLLLEIKPSIYNSPDLSNLLYSKIIEGLCELQHEFKTDYEEIYKKFDNDPTKKILRIEICKWPFLSKELLKKTKRRRIKERK
ncbi:MAG: hypothetical protein WCP46_09810, partial [Alphaproteobacteria bacterium]